MSKDNRDLLVGLDIGTSKVVALVAELGVDGQFNVVGVGQTASKGLKKGVVVNIEATVQSIQKALEEAEVMADRQIVQVANCDVALCILQGCMRTRSHIPPNGRWAALEQLLEIVKRDRKWNDEAARKQLVKLFEALGFDDPLAIDGRRRLSSILFA